MDGASDEKFGSPYPMRLWHPGQASQDRWQYGLCASTSWRRLPDNHVSSQDFPYFKILRTPVPFPKTHEISASRSGAKGLHKRHNQLPIACPLTSCDVKQPEWWEKPSAPDLTVAPTVEPFELAVCGGLLTHCGASGEHIRHVSLNRHILSQTVGTKAVILHHMS